MIWTDRHRVVLAALLAGLLLALAIRYHFHRAYVPIEQEAAAPRAPDLLDRVDPNTADWPTLAALPLISKTVAQRIVDERQAFLAAHPGQILFAKPDDLLRIKGIGPATVRTIEPYLTFPPSPTPATRP
jgi:DNA uptake protein ComE-like DNA-binding protein